MRYANVYCTMSKFWEQSFMLLNTSLLSGRSANANMVEG